MSHPTNKDQGDKTVAEEMASRLERMPFEQADQFFKGLSVRDAALALTKLDLELAMRLAAGLPDEEFAACVRGLPPSLVADLVLPLHSSRQAKILTLLPLEESQSVSALLPFAPDSAGGIMDNRFIAAQVDESVDQCLARLRASQAHRSADVGYLYAVDSTKKLAGIVSFRDLALASDEERIRDIMNPKVIFLRTTDDQEKIVRQLQHHSYLGLPVIDDYDRLVGVVKAAEAVRVAQTEATEDMQLMVGLSGEEKLWTPWHQAIRKRLPWLFVNLGTALLAGLVVSAFEETISRWTAIVVFLPLISAVSGNAGMQALTVIVRSLALDEVSVGDAVRAMRKELALGTANGFGLGLTIGLVSYGWKGSLLLGLVSGAAMLLNQILGCLAGVLVPFGLRRCNIDPALASSIFVTTLTDVIGFLIFLGLASFALRFYGI